MGNYNDFNIVESFFVLKFNMVDNLRAILRSMNRLKLNMLRLTMPNLVLVEDSNANSNNALSS